MFKFLVSHSLYSKYAPLLVSPRIDEELVIFKSGAFQFESLPINIELSLHSLNDHSLGTAAQHLRQDILKCFLWLSSSITLSSFIGVYLRL